jgi:myo-inositol-1(or 4)-monophosphatase
MTFYPRSLHKNNGAMKENNKQRDEVQVMLDTVRKAGNMFLAEFKQKDIPQNKTDFSAQLDEIEARCLAILQQGLSTAFPDTPWRGNEFDYEEQRQPLDLPEYWLCDTMDGAIQYMQHLPGWTINLVQVRHGQLHFGVIYDPLLQEMFFAEAGKGAYLNDRLIRPAAKTDLKAMLAVFEYAFPYVEVPGLNQQIGASIGELLDHFGVVRNYGPHGLQLAYVGAGRIDLFYQRDLDTYNWLPGILIAREAGAEILTTDGRPWTWGAESLIVAPAGVAGKFLQAVTTTQKAQV